jgi:hypothetical protein
VGLRLFHLFFIAVSVLLSAFVAAWGASGYRQTHEVVYAVWALCAVALSAVLVVYGAVFQRKTRNL